MDYISTLPVKVVDDRTPIFDELVEENRCLVFNITLNVGLHMLEGDGNAGKKA